MALEIGGGITFGGGITVEIPSTATNISTEILEPLLTESGLNLITES
jgi:hypothetical protein